MTTTDDRCYLQNMKQAKQKECSKNKKVKQKSTCDIAEEATTALCTIS